MAFDNHAEDSWPVQRRSRRGRSAAPYFVPTSAFGANEKVIVGFIGVGGRGMQNAPAHMGQIAAACDVDKNHLASAISKFGGKCTGYSDFRHLLDRKDIDGVVITTPDHWHTIPTIEPAKRASMSTVRSLCRCS